MKIAILGFGKEGKSTYNWLLKNGYKKEQIDILDKSISKNYLENLEKYDIIYKTPGISIYLSELQKVKDKIQTQADILFKNFKGKLILVSGSKGKSTTSTLLYLFLKQAGKKVKLVGNIGNPILDEIDFENQPDYIVFEISSYMLDSSKNIWSSYSILTNIYENVHISWHKNFENYLNAKLKFFSNTNFGILRKDTFQLVKNKLDKIKNIVLFGPETKYYFDDKFIYSPKYKIDLNKIKIGGNHNYLNICACLPVLEDENISQQDIEKVLEDFGGLEHRQEFVSEIDGVKFYNDSIATIPESVLQALERFGNNIGTLILGGKDEKFDYSKLIKKINELEIKNIILLPDSFDKWLDKFENKEIFQVNSMKDAVKISKEKTPAGKIVLLSPGAPSYNMFKNFEERGIIFKNEVRK